MSHARPIGIFDSGVGGLTVLREIDRLLPHEDVVYFGDTARVPYGTKSSETVVRFAEQDCRFLLEFDPKLIVVACNTASSYALEHLAGAMPVPVVGVVEPGAAAAVAATRTGRIGIVATEATVSSQSYVRTIARLSPQATVVQQAAPLLVPIVEEGRAWDHPIVEMVLEEYLESLKRARVDVVVLGCTHYPLVKRAVAAIMGPEVMLVDSAAETARTVKARLASEQTDRPACPRKGTRRYFSSDNPQRFRQIGSRFLDAPIDEVAHTHPDELALKTVSKPNG